MTRIVPRPAVAGVVLVAALLALGGIAVVAADAAAGPAAGILAGAGPLARHGAPVVGVIADLAGALVLGGAVVAGWVVHRDAPTDRLRGSVTAATAGWTLAQLALLLASYAVATGQPIGSPRFGSDLPVYLASELGRWLLTSLVLAAATTVLAVGGTGRSSARALAVLAGTSLFAKAMTGHASGSAGHEVATTTMVVHLLAMGVWVGGLAALQLVTERGDRVPGAIRRFSRLALVCWVALLASGIWAIAVRMNGPGDLLTSAYVQLGALKLVILALLGGAGIVQRRLLAAPDLAVDHRLFRHLAILELALMGLAVSLAAAMSSSPPPAERAPAPTDPAELLTGYPMPPAPGLPEALSVWRPDPFALAALAVILLAWWWPTTPRRDARATRLLVVACAVALVVLCGPLAVYAKVLFSAHLALHAALATVVGPLLGAASGRLLTRRAAPAAAAAPAVLLGLAYAWPPLTRAVVGTHVGHLLLLVGSALVGALLGMALRSRPAVSAVVAGVLLAAGGAFLALGDAVVLPSWFGATGRAWLSDALADQQRAGWALLGWAAAWTVLAVLLGGRAAQRRPAPSPNSARTERSRARVSSRSTNGS